MDAAGILCHLRGSGFDVSLEADGLHVGPRHRLTPELRELIRANRSLLVAYLDDDRQPRPGPQAPATVSTSPPDPEPAALDLRPHFPAALRAGALVTCGGCRYFEYRPDSRPDGCCLHHEVEAWAFVPFRCQSHEVNR